MPPSTWTWTQAWLLSWTRPNESSRARTCWKVRTRSSGSAIPSIQADDIRAHEEPHQMSEIGRFGVFLPSYVWAGDGPERARGIKAFARTVEDLGFDSLFITDHLVADRRFYSVSFLEPLAALAMAAGVTERVRLGTSILIMPLRNPVLLAKELATLQFLSENRVILGAGVGWNDAEYDAVGVRKSERGKRTDEMLDIMIPLLEGETVTYRGRYYSVDDLFIEPTASQRPESWIGGGSQLADPKSPDLPRFVESVKARVMRTDGWI